MRDPTERKRERSVFRDETAGSDFERERESATRDGTKGRSDRKREQFNTTIHLLLRGPQDGVRVYPKT